MELNSLVEILANHADNIPDKAYIIEGESERTISYGEFWRLCRQFAVRLLRMGLKQGDRVLVPSKCAAETIVAQFGIYLAGGVFCPVEANARPHRLIELMTYLDVSFLVSAQNVDYDSQWIDYNTVCTDTNMAEEYTLPFPDPTSLSTIIFTTGTTGKAKGVMLSHKNQLAIARNLVRAYSLGSQEIILNPMPLSHASGIRRTHISLFAGVTMVLHEGVIFINSFFESIRKYNITTVFLAPSYLSILIDNASDMLKQFGCQLQKLGISTSFTSEAQKNLLCELLPNTQLFIAYGATECGNLSFYEFSKNRNSPLCVGKPNIEADIMLLDSDGQPFENSSKDNPGIISSAGDHIMLGYWQDPKLTEKVIIANRLLLADVGYWGQDGLLYLLGRRDDVINIGGNKVAPYEIEDLIARLPYVKECACIPVPDKVLGNAMKLLIVTNSGVEFSHKDIFAYLIENLEPFKIPRYIEHVSSLPKAGSVGKINKAMLTKGVKP